MPLWARYLLVECVSRFFHSVNMTTVLLQIHLRSPLRLALKSAHLLATGPVIALSPHSYSTCDRQSQTAEGAVPGLTFQG